jgi:hypothetical protein
MWFKETESTNAEECAKEDFSNSDRVAKSANSIRSDTAQVESQLESFNVTRALISQATELGNRSAWGAR